MKIYDVTRILNGLTPIFPGDPTYSLETFEQNGFNISKISLGSHTGTHIDAPKHLTSLQKDVDSIPLDFLIGECVILDFSQSKEETLITYEMIELSFLRLNRSFAERVLIKTSNFSKGMSLEACMFLKDKGLKIIGIDLQSIENESDTMPVHNFLLKNNIPILEFLDLKEISEGEYTLIALPLRLQNSDASPCRVVLTS